MGSSLTKGIGIPFAAAFLGWYAVFIILVTIEDIREKRDNKRTKSQLEDPMVEDEPERKLSAWEEDEEEEEKAKEEYLKDLVRQKTNTAINRNKSIATESDFQEVAQEEPEEEKEEKLGDDEEHRVKGGIEEEHVKDAHFDDEEVDTADNEKGAPIQRQKTRL